MKTKPGTQDPVRERILAGARRYFFAQGFRGVTMDDLAAELGMSKKTLYTQFPSKAVLLEAVVDNKFTGLGIELQRITRASADDFPTALRELLTCLQRETAEVQAPFVRDVRRAAPELFKCIQVRRRAVIQKYFGHLFQEGRRAGFLRRDIPVSLMIEILLGATEAIMTPPRVAELGLTLQNGFSAIVSVVLEGVIARKGRSAL